MILANCLRSLKCQTKGELALQEVNKTISFIGEKFDAYEKDRRKNFKNEELNGTVSKMNEKIEELESKIDFQKQYWRRNCILIYGITKNKEENTDQQVTGNRFYK